MNNIEAVLAAIAMICATALIIRLSTASVTRGRMWLFGGVVFLLYAVGHLTHVLK